MARAVNEKAACITNSGCTDTRAEILMKQKCKKSHLSCLRVRRTQTEKEISSVCSICFQYFTSSLIDITHTYTHTRRSSKAILGHYMFVGEEKNNFVTDEHLT